MRLHRKVAESGSRLRQVHPRNPNNSASAERTDGRTLVIFCAGDFSISVEKIQVSFKSESYTAFTFRLKMVSSMKCTQMRTVLFWALEQRVEAIPLRRFGIAYRSHIQGCGHLKLREVYAAVKGKKTKKKNKKKNNNSSSNRYLILFNRMCNKY
jgi:hypothetical protein